MRTILTNDHSTILEPLVAEAKLFAGGVPPRLPDRMFFESILYWTRTGIPWRDLPSEFGRWDAVYNRFGRWGRSGSLQRLFELLTANPDLGELRRMLIDSTVIHAHQHAAGVQRREKKRCRTKYSRERSWLTVDDLKVITLNEQHYASGDAEEILAEAGRGDDDAEEDDQQGGPAASNLRLVLGDREPAGLEADKQVSPVKTRALMTNRMRRNRLNAEEPAHALDHGPALPGCGR